MARCRAAADGIILASLTRSPGVGSRRKEQPGYDKVGLASWYGPQFHRRHTSNGEWFDMNYLTAAHATLPLPSYAKVTNLQNGREVIVRINDRGPFVGDRIIDLSRQAADRARLQGAGEGTASASSISDPHR